MALRLTIYFPGLGKSVPELGLEEFGITAIEKTKFSMCLAPILENLKKTPSIDSVILCGIETHVCIQQTALDFKAEGYEVFVIADACSSRGRLER
jgi:nicotinamidase-related amidase